MKDFTKELWDLLVSLSITGVPLSETQSPSHKGFWQKYKPE